MSRTLVILGTLLFAAALVQASEDPTESLSGVIDLTPDNFDQYVNGKKHALVEFYAPWCGHCKRLTPEYKKLGEQIAADPKLSSRVVIGKVDADKYREIGTQFGVQGFPTLKFFPRGKPVDKPEDYKGGRTAAEFLRVINEALAADNLGRVEVLDPIASKFIDINEKEELLKEAQKLAGILSGEDAEHAALYIKYMQKAIEKGPEYLTNELARLERVAGGKLSPAKATEILKKIAVLSAFKPELEEDDAEEA